jgi:hypothetical protein
MGAQCPSVSECDAVSRMIGDASKGAELSNPLGPGSEPTGNTVYVLDEIYESEAGVTNHWTLSQDWPDMGAVVAAAGKAQVTTQHRGRVINSLA